MDDWNDFGDPVPSNLHAIVSSPTAPYADSPSDSTLDTFSDSAATLLDQHPSSQPASQRGSHSHAEMSSSNLPPPRSSTRFSSLPFFQSVRQRRADRAAAAAAAATAAAAAHAANNNSSNNISSATSTAADTLVDEHGRSSPSDIRNDIIASPVSDSQRNQTSNAPTDIPETSSGNPHNFSSSLWPTDVPIAGDNNISPDPAADDMSAVSEDDDVEPRSVMMPVTKRRPPPDNALGEDPHEPDDDNTREDPRGNNSLLGFSPRRGELDNVPDDFELNVEGFRFTAVKSVNSTSDGELEPASSIIPSSLLKYLDKSYIKLEVISAKQIRGLLLFFNAFALMSIAYSLILVVLYNTKFKNVIQVPLPLIFLPRSVQRRNADQACYTLFEEGPQPFSCSFVPPDSEGVAFRLLESPVPFPTSPSCSMFNAESGVNSAGMRLLAALGIYPSAGGFYFGAPCPLPQTNASANVAPFSTDVTPRQVDQGETLQPDELFPPDTKFGQIIKIPGTTMSIRQRLVHHIVASVLGVFFLVLAVLFALRLRAAGNRNVTHEQVWTFILILAAGLYFNPFENIIDIMDAVRFIRGDSDGERFSEPVLRTSEFLSVVRDASFMTFIYFYLWANFHSYRILDSTQRLKFVSFYLLKLVILAPLVAFHITTYLVVDLRFSGVPLLSAPSFAFLVSSYNFLDYIPLEFWLCIARTGLDVIALLLMLREGLLTMRTLQQAPYMKYRAKKVGFRFFIYINSVFYFLFYILFMIIFFGKPPGDSLVTFGEVPFEPHVGLPFFHSAGLWPLITGYVLSTAYVHLPYTCSGWLKGWFRSVPLGPSGSRWSFPSFNSETRSGRDNKEVVVSDIRSKADKCAQKGSKQSPSNSWPYDVKTPQSLVDNDAELQQQIIEPITYRKRESKDSLELKANCFTMQTHVIMFNFAWYVYYYGTPKLENFRPKENPLPFQFAVDKHVKSSETDTQALILSCTDRIIITFKGTTSMRNLKTSIQLNFEHLHSVVRLNADGEDESMRLKKLFGSRYMTGRIHKGFATAYKSVMDEVVSRVRLLRKEKPRPVFLTGHSLGGALATICSLDLWVKLKINRREIFVSTFGSPRVGNSDFATVYREVVPLHWRIVVAPDMIAKLPRVGYKHVGKKVVLTPQGDMLIDPDALEHRPWTGEAAGFAYHRKASYLLAMRAWCVRNHGLTYTPVFWPFPVRPEDERRFAGAFDPDEEQLESEGGRKVAEKIIRLDAMVDALGDDQGLDNMAVVEKWARLTRRALLNDKLGGAKNS